MPRRERLAGALYRGVIAGAVGTLALDTATYADMVVRGRPPSEVPEKMAQRFVDNAGISLGDDPETATNRRSGLATILGYLTGVTGGVAYALLRRRNRDASTAALGLALGFGVMAMTDTSSTIAGVTDPRSWGIGGWTADALFHAVYGVVTASTFDSWSRSQRL